MALTRTRLSALDRPTGVSEHPFKGRRANAEAMVASNADGSFTSVCTFIQEVATSWRKMTLLG